MVLKNEIFTEHEKYNNVRSLDGCVCRICVSDDPLEILRMVAFGNDYLGMLAQNRILQLKEENKL